MSKKKVLIIQPIHEKGESILQEHFDVHVTSDYSLPHLLDATQDVNGIVVRNAHLPAEVILKAHNLEVIGRHGIGIDNIDVGAATSRGIPVLNTPHANDLSVAEHVITVMGALAKNLFFHNTAVRQGQFFVRNEHLSTDIEGKTLGLVGFGHIGQLVCKKSINSFNMRVLAYDPFICTKTITSLGAIPCSLDELFSQADFVSLHIPLNKHTTHMIGLSQLSQMKSSAFLINASRGQVVHESSLIQVLENKQIAGAAVDVFENEPPALDNPLFRLNNVLLTPHCAGLTIEAAIRISTNVAEGVRDVLLGHEPKHIVNPDYMTVNGQL